MIQANELRTGNYVKGESLTIPKLEVLSDGTMQISAYGIHLLEYKIETLLDPIPLTEEWLFKFGFNKCPSKFRDKPDILSIQISNTESLDYEDEEFFIADVSGNRAVTFWNNPKYVHQLQNLYFVLTGEELTIKE